MSVHINSFTAYLSEFEKLDKRAKLIYGHLAMEQRPMTDREIKDSLFGPSADMNMVRPRISEMKAGGWIVEIGRQQDKVTGQNVRLVKTVSPTERISGQGTFL